MRTVTATDVKKLKLPSGDSHKGQNGKLLLIGGSELFHAASLWSLTVASRIVDLVHYSSIPENNDIVQKNKDEFRNGIVISRADLSSYIEEDDVVLMGPGMTRDEETRELTHSLLTRYPKKQYVLDAGALQMLDLADLPHGAILTPHHAEFSGLIAKYQERSLHVTSVKTGIAERIEDQLADFAKTYQCIVLVKGVYDLAVNTDGECLRIEGGNSGMTKGGTGDVLAGLIAALATMNDPFLSTIAGSFINKRAGDDLYTTVGPFFNATDLANQIPKTMNELLHS